MAKKEYIGDGKAFYELVANSKKTIAEVQKELNISNGTLYNYYESEQLAQDVKEMISRWAKRSVVVIFGDNSKIQKDSAHTNNIPHFQEQKAEKEESINSNDSLMDGVNLQPPISQGGNDMNTLQSMQRTQENYSIAEKNRSEAAKDTAKTQLILAELLQLKFGEDGLKKAAGM